jgi:exopolyphosphatase/pppGpp-phosphohydrolase
VDLSTGQDLKRTRRCSMDKKSVPKSSGHPPTRADCRSAFELGTQSLKFHALHRGAIYTEKYPYALGHEVYSSGAIAASTIQQVVDTVRKCASRPCVAVATGAVRDAENRADLFNRLEEHLELGAHLLSSWEEASLLAVGYLATARPLPALVADLGGGSLEIIFLSKTRNLLWDSLPLGAIRLHYSPGKDLTARTEHLEHEFRKASLVRADEIYLTGGTAKAIVTVLRKQTVERQELEALELLVRRNGPPSILKPQRAAVFHSGLLVALKLLEYVRAERLHYLSVSVGRTFLGCATRQIDAPRVTQMTIS